MQLTGFSNRCATGTTRHRQYLLRGEFLCLHNSKMQRYIERRCSLLHIVEYIFFEYIKPAAVAALSVPPPNPPRNCEQK